MIAHAAHNPWVANLARGLARWPVDLLWSRTDREAISLIADRSIHAGIVDNALPQTSGLDLVRRMRKLGVDAPCLLVCDDANDRVLHDALELDIFSVVQTQTNQELIVPMLVRVVQQKYKLTWTPITTFN